ncbi:MAG TPA: hypothetical protein VKL99_13720 [Candidatus Angelobacter sp.]|nr:hypothetical protein [Candidatus Angelobacter sp.]
MRPQKGFRGTAINPWRLHGRNAAGLDLCQRAFLAVWLPPRPAAGIVVVLERNGWASERARPQARALAFCRSDLGQMPEDQVSAGNPPGRMSPPGQRPVRQKIYHWFY